MRIYLESLGCRLNYAEMAALGRRLTGAGHELAASAEDADLCVVNSCAVTGEAARQSRQLARRLARTNPAARLVVTGCYATLEAATAAKLPNVALVVGNAAKDDLLALIQEEVESGRFKGEGIQPSSPKPEPSTFDLQPVPDLQPARTRAFVKVQDGCHNHCTFCIATVARGEERSRPIAEVVAEVNALHADGYQEAVLTGVHLGGYGSDTGADLRQLVAALLVDTTIPHLRVSSLEPFDLRPDFFELWAESSGRLMPHLHLPAQSGSDAVLRRMGRRNRVGEFERLAESARERIPGLTLTTDLIVGFPGETDADFAQTMAFARRMAFAHLHVFPYSARAGTAAARFAGQVPEVERKRRVHTLTELDAELGAAVRRSFIGQVRPVLWEHPKDENAIAEHSERNRGRGPGGVEGCGATFQARPHPSSPSRVLPRDSAHAKRACLPALSEPVVIWSGLTDNYLRVLTTARPEANWHNRITLTRLTRLDGDDLWGEIAAEGEEI